MVLLFLLIIPGTLFASTLRISWNNNTEADLCGYRVYYGTISGQYGKVLDVGEAVCVDIEGLPADTVYFFAITAYDFSGNESGFSREVSVLIPGDQARFLGAIINWFLELIPTNPGSTDDAPRYSLDDFFDVSSSIPVNTASIVEVGDSASVPPDGDFPAGSEGTCLVEDAIAVVGEVLDLSTLYPTGTYEFTPLTAGCPAIDDGMIYAAAPGSHLFLVKDMTGGLINILRVSVVRELCAAADYLPGTDLVMGAISGLISLVMPQNTLGSALPIGIDCGSAASGAGSAVLAHGTNEFGFDIVPYGLVLAEPAVVSVLYDGPYPVAVAYFDEAARQWVELEDVWAEDGMVTFSTQVLGSFKVYAPREDADSYEGSGGGGGGCFIDTAHNTPGPIGAALASLLLVVLCASVRHVWPGTGSSSRP